MITLAVVSYFVLEHFPSARLRREVSAVGVGPVHTVNPFAFLLLQAGIYHSTAAAEQGPGLEGRALLDERVFEQLRLGSSEGPGGYRSWQRLGQLDKSG